ncbi:MAG: nicotinate phosphoribosyltransferase [Candidatus Solincola sediminis]|uniref:nicotinate phosphoribosyltransferase n=1 Tax=Candidatus Solincola sediminis TaxID=1797199 RepID=A0A1F2WGT2_9ACTN|nr:MAG: nicotinate phosphoribosyltransferase [Candidatus Solincola sediminis]
MFHISSAEEILQGKVTDVYFTNVEKSLRHLGLNPHVAAEIRAGSLPDDWAWAVFAGLEESLKLMQGRKLDLYALSEGTTFAPEDTVLIIEGNYLEFAIFETALLGFLCEASGVATKAARCRVAAGDRMVLSFGARRMHPAIAPMIERNAYIGGCDGVSAVSSAELIGEKPLGTMAHSLMICVGDEKKAFKAFNAAVEPEVRRVALVDTFQDEKFGALTAAEALGQKLYAVRLDTPSSRRGDFLKIMREVRWELDTRGFRDVKIFLSGGLDEYDILRYNSYADAYGVGTAISNAPVVDFAFDIVEVEGQPRAKRGKMSGKKQTFRCPECEARILAPFNDTEILCPCGGTGEPLLTQYIENGEIVKDLQSAQDIRRRVMSEIENRTIEPGA